MSRRAPTRKPALVTPATFSLPGRAFRPTMNRATTKVPTYKLRAENGRPTLRGRSSSTWDGKEELGLWISELTKGSSHAAACLGTGGNGIDCRADRDRVARG